MILIAIFFPFFGWSSLIILLGGFFIDVDHYLIYVIKKKDISLIRAYNYFRYGSNNDFKDHPLIFHFVELTAILIIFSFFNYLVLLLTIGVLTHLLLDLIHEIRNKNDVDIGKNWSFITWIKRQI
ncbi:hypothetical protein KY313_01225 [Candidatus Woesearchaeota archaeon]|jgi:hypothetical protein|nr:hypothetical protein [Candidatus Woesearchaeota archaeon]